MTSVTSLNNKRRFNFFTFTLKKQTPLTLLVTAFSLLFCPGTLLNQILEKIARYEAIFSGEKPEMDDYFVGYAIAIFLIGVGLMILLTITNFGFLYSKKSGDVFHALPLKRSELLTMRMLSSFIGAAFTMSVSYISLVIVNAMPNVIPIDAATLFATYGAMLAGLIMLTVFTTVFAISSGGVFDFIIAIGGINVALPLIYLVFMNFLENNSYGVVYNNFESQLIYTTPFAFTAMTVIELAENGVEGVKEFFLDPRSYVNVITVVIYIVFTALCIFAVYKLFKIRRSETAGESYSFGFIPHIISVLVSIVGGYALGYIFTGYSFANLGFWLFFIIGIILCSITAGAIFSRGFKTVKVSMIRGGIAVGISLILCVSLIFVSGHAENYIPKAEDIKKITVGYNEQVEFTENYDIVLDIHKEILGKNEKKSATGDAYEDSIKYREYESYRIVDEFDGIRIHYYMKNGAIHTRQYFSLTDPVFDALFIRYARSDEYLKQYTDFEGIVPLVEVQSIDYGEKITHNEKPVYGAVEPEKAMEIITTYAEEFKNAPDSAFYESCDLFELFGVSENSYSTTLRVPESFAKTRAVIATVELEENYPEELKYKD